MSQAVKPKVDVDASRARLQELGLNHTSEMLNQLLTQAVKEEVAPHVFLDRMLAIEYRQREERRVRTSLRLSGLPTGMTLGNFDFAFQPGIEKSRIETLATCSWVREHETVLLQGPPGIGKTRTWRWPWGCGRWRTGFRWPSTASTTCCTR